MKEFFVKICGDTATRVPHRKGKTGRPCRDMEALPSREAFRRPDRGWIRVGFSAMTRWLERRIGRKWEDVFSELCSITNREDNNSVQLRRWVTGRVETHTFVDTDGVVRCNSRFGANMEFRKGDYYVDPRDGTLRKYNPPQKVKPVKPTLKIQLSPLRELRKLDGCWFEVDLIKAPESVWNFDRVARLFSKEYYLSGIRDVVTGEWVHRRGELIAVTKRQLSKKELKLHGVEND